MKKIIYAILVSVLMCFVSCSGTTKEYDRDTQINVLASNLPISKKIEFLNTDSKFIEYVDNWNANNEYKIHCEPGCILVKPVPTDEIMILTNSVESVHREYSFVILFAGDFDIPGITIDGNGKYVIPSEDNGMVVSTPL